MTISKLGKALICLMLFSAAMSGKSYAQEASLLGNPVLRTLGKWWVSPKAFALDSPIAPVGSVHGRGVISSALPV